VVLPPGAWSIGRTLTEVRSRDVAVPLLACAAAFSTRAGRGYRIRDGDIVVIYGQPGT
jgi:hypothetical protein